MQNKIITLEKIPPVPKEALCKVANLSCHKSARDKEHHPASNIPEPFRIHNENSKLGSVKMDAYLEHYGITFRIKKDSKKTLYLLEKCLFNSDHGPWQSSIVVPINGPITYQCFHSSCSGHSWKEARKIISGDKPIAEFCDGYDPNWTAPRTTGTGIFSEDTIIDILPHEEEPVYGLNDELISPPSEVDWREFYTKGRMGRDEFVPLYLVRYLQQYLHPLANTAKQFWKYSNGVWKPYSDSLIRQHITRALKEKVQGRMTDNVIKILEDQIYRSEKQWDQNPTLINCLSGMINIKSGEILPHDPKYFSRIQLPVNYDPQKESVRWFEFLKDIFPEDFADTQNAKSYMMKHYLLQQWFGYCLLGDNRFHKALFLYGTGSNGKSTVIEVLQAMVGETNVSNLSLSDLCQRFKIQHLLGKMVNLSTETGSRDPLTMDIFKAIVAGETLSAERKFGDVFEFRPSVKFCVSMNDAPVISDKSYGLERRLIVLSFNRRIEKNEIVPNMKALLIEEIDGIFTWAIRGLQDLLRRNGFYIGEIVGEDTDQFMKTINPLLIFGEECCEFGDDYETEPQTLWEAYKRWCDDGKNRPLGRNNFYNQILAQYPSVKRERSELKRLFRGIRLKSL
ncbi:MAG: hypothetical protein APR62_01485 [Smithella sp. SDB]|nr:MAG: hypothetical protein APR62_01485 [Smithella sp. SDB]